MSSSVLIELAIESPAVKLAFEQVLSTNQVFVIKRPKAQGVPRLVVFELDTVTPSRSFERVHSIMSVAPQTEVFIVSPSAESSLLLEALRAGVREFLPQPISREDIQRALNRFKERSNAVQALSHERTCKVISMLGAKGGIGTTLLAVNLAGFLQKLEDGKTILLIDLNFEASDVPLFLDIEPVHSLRDVSENIERLDGTFLMNVLTRHGTGFYVLPLGYQQSMVEQFPISNDAVHRTLELVQSLFDYVIIDCGHVLDVPRRSALALSSSVVLISTLHVPVIRSTKDILDLLRESGHSSEKVKLIMNRFEPTDDALLKNTEEAVSLKVSILIPNNSQIASSAVNNGQLLVSTAPQADISQSIQRLAESLVGTRTTQERASFFGNYLKTVKAKWAGDKPQPSTA